jgi:D-arabinan exo alpha-(1,3)/(1,5)-arabinofuranosidase (non-reducing end)
MRSQRPFLIALLCALFLPCLAATARANDDLGALLDRLTGVDHLDRPARKGERLMLFSSTSPRARAAEPGTPTWFANDDRGHVLRTDNGKAGAEYVLAETEGPGAIVRIWSGNPAGTLRIYVDGALVVEEDMARLLSGKVAWCPEPLANKRSLGSVSHFPVPFAKSIRVTATEKDLYYHVGIRRFPEGRPVNSLTRNGLKAARNIIERAARRLAAAEETPVDRSGEKGGGTQTFYLHGVPPDGGGSFIANSPYQTALFTPRPSGGRSVLTDLTITEFACNQPAAALAGTVLAITFDGEETVRAPLGAFFACGTGGGKHVGLPAGLSKDVEGWRLYCRFPMPFERAVSVQIENRSGVDVAGRLSWRVRPAQPDETLRFGVLHREHLDLPTRPRRDLTLAQLEGAGRIVGVALTANNPVNAWWGEGDEKVTIDGESKPSLWGTGTEDFFGDAWSSQRPYTHALHGQPANEGPGSRGLTSMVRWLVPDDMAFARSIRFDLGLWHHEDVRMDLFSTVFFYLQ